MSRGFITDKIGCNVCMEMLPWLLFYNTVADVGDEITIVDTKMSNSELEWLIDIVREEAPHLTSLPTPFGVIDGVFVNMIRTGEHFYNFLKHSIE